jgi:heme-degrading monooxygenase HmoA
MILETAAFTVPPESGGEFEQALAQACGLFARAPGYIRHEIRRGIEQPGSYLLLVWWETIEAHTVEFRNSPEFGRWRALVRPHYTGSAEVKHHCLINPPPDPTRFRSP